MKYFVLQMRILILYIVLHAAKKRKSRAANSESSSTEIDAAAPRNASDLVSGGKHYSNEEKLVSPQKNVSRGKTTNSLSIDSSSEGSEGRNQIENSECNGEQPVTTQENGSREKAAFSSSGECSSEENIERGQIENGECNEEKTVTSQENILREKITSSSSGECSLDENCERGQIEKGGCNEEQPVISQENDLREEATSSSEECSLDGSSGRVQIENGKCDEEKLVLFNLSDEEPEDEVDIYKLSDIRRHTVSNRGYSNELPQASAEVMADNSVEKANETNLKLEEDEEEQNMALERTGNQLISALDREDASDENSALVGVTSEVDIGESDLEVEREINNRNLSQEGADQKMTSGSISDGQCVDNDKLVLVGDRSETVVNGPDNADSKELNGENLSLQRIERLSNENFVSEKGNISYVSRRELKEGTSNNHAYSPKNIRHSFDDLRSAGTFDSAEVNNLSLEINGVLRELSKSPTARSSHAYDGSVSSNDGMDERFLGQNLYSFEGGSRKGKGVVKSSMLYEDVEMQSQSNFPNRMYQNDVLETKRGDHANRVRTKTDEFPFPYKMPLHGSSPQSGYESGSPSNQIYNELYLSSSYVSPDSIEDPDQEKMKLLRMVYKLQDQLNRTNHANKETNERLSAGNHISSYQSHDSHEGRFYHGLDYPRGDANESYSHANKETNERLSAGNHISSYQSYDSHEGRFYHGLDYPRGDANASYSHGINIHQRRHNFSHVPYSTEPTSNAHHIDHPYFNCCPQEGQHLGEFPPCFPYQREDLHRPHPVHSRCLSQHSYPSSPQWLINSKHVHGRETKSCDQRYRATEMNYTRTRDKLSLTKRHYRPVAGAAPFVTCHKCLNLLQLPADFLLFKRLCHKLKCGACQEVLKFSLQNKSHVVSYTPNAVGPPSSDLDVQNKLINGINTQSEPHVADRVSYSDDYGHSISKSYSSEGDPVSVAPFPHSHASARENPSVSPGTVDAVTEKEKTASRGPSTSKAPSNMSSEREAPQSLPKPSSLHQLMGYSSPSQVLRGAPVDEGKEVMKYIFGEAGHYY